MLKKVGNIFYLARNVLVMANRGLFSYVFFITVATTISVGYFATKIALILECVYLVCESVLLDSVPWKENEQRFLPSNHSTSIRLDGVEKLTKAKRKRLTR